MIRTLIFDFGDVFINLDKHGALQNALQLFNRNALSKTMVNANNAYEVGALSSQAFLDIYKTEVPHVSNTKLIEAWNFIIKDFPIRRLQWLQQLAQRKTYNLILLSNTNSMHIDYIKANVPFYNDFKSCFDAFYLSHEIELRKPNAAIYNFVLQTHQLKPQECFFVDDTKANTDAANTLGIHTWNIDETKEDVTQLFTKFKHLL